MNKVLFAFILIYAFIMLYICKNYEKLYDSVAIQRDYIFQVMAINTDRLQQCRSELGHMEKKLN